MLLTPHTLVGIAIGATVQNPLIAVPLSFVAHFIGDLVPHWDFFDHFPSKEEMFSGWPAKAFFTDVAIGIIFGLGFTLYALNIKQDPSLAINIFLCGIVSVVPDAMYAPILFFNSKNRLIRFFYGIQERMHVHANIVYGNLTQIAVSVLAFLVTLSSLAR